MVVRGPRLDHKAVAQRQILRQVVVPDVSQPFILGGGRLEFNKLVEGVSYPPEAYRNRRPASPRVSHRYVRFNAADCFQVGVIFLGHFQTPGVVGDRSPKAAVCML